MIIRGKVVRGLGIGKKLGYPTANLKLSFVYRTKLSFRRLLGVYATRDTVDGAPHDAVAVIGARFENGQPLLEVHFLDFSGELRGKELEVEVLDKVSEIEIFKNEKIGRA